MKARSLARRIPGVLLVALFAGLTLYPVGRFLLSPIFAGRARSLGDAGGFANAALVDSVRIGLESTLCAVGVGVPLAWLSERRRWTGDRALTLTLWLVFVTPSYLLTTGWQIVFSQPWLAHGRLSAAFYGEGGIVFLLALKGLPFATLAARTSWRAVGAELVEAAHVLIPRKADRRLAILQLLLPAAASAFAIVFVESIQEFGVPATLGAQIHLPIITYAIYERLTTTPVDFLGTALLSWRLVALAFVAVAVQLFFAERYSNALIHGRSRILAPPPCTKAEAVFAWGALLTLGALGLGIPLSALVKAAMFPQQVAAVRGADWPSLVYSSLYSMIAALAAVTLAAPILFRQRSRDGTLGSVVGALSLANMALPGVVLGAAYLIAFNGGPLPLYGTPLLLVLAYVAVQTPMLLRFLQAPIDHVHPNLSEAARLHRVPWATRVLDIDAPLLAPAFTWGWMMAFVQVFFELPISELLYPAGRAPVGVALVWLNQTLDYTDEARLALAAICVALTLALGFAALARWLTSAPLVGQPA